MTEAYATPSAVALMNAFQDAAMLEPSSAGTGLLFDPGTFDIHQYSEGGINNGGLEQFVVPLTKVIIVVNVPYGNRQSYMNLETDEDWSLWCRLRVYGNTGADIADALGRLEFLSMHRRNVLSLHGIADYGIDQHPRMKPYDPKLGFATLDYTLRYRWSPDS
jgi:hypothetical protein